MQEQKKYHRLKLLNIDLIFECEERIFKEESFKKRINSSGLFGVLNISQTNIKRYERIKTYLTERYNRNKITDKN